jgi:peptidoglycan/LPS O-acetylase OafA/YrhL
MAAHVVGLWTNAEHFRWFPWQLYLGVIDLVRFDHQAGGHVGLLLFFVVSGYIVSQAAEGERPLAFVVKRAARLLPAMPLGVALALLAGALAAANGWPTMPEFNAGRAFSAWSLLEAVGLGTTFGGIAALFVLWSLNVEYYWYALLGSLLGPANFKPLSSTLLMSAILLLAYLLAPLFAGPVFLAQADVSCVFVILIGRWIYLADRGFTSNLVATCGAVGMALLYGILQWPFAGRDVWTGAHPHILAVAWAALLFLALLRLVKGALWRPIAFIADISYGLYLFHVPVMFLVLPLLSPGGRLFPLGIAVTVLLTIALAWLSFRFIETPIREGARRLLARRKKAADIAPVSS